MSNTGLVSRVTGKGQVELNTVVDCSEHTEVIKLVVGLELSEDIELVLLTTADRLVARHC